MSEITYFEEVIMSKLIKTFIIFILFIAYYSVTASAAKRTDDNIYYSKCGSCHGTEFIDKKIKTKSEWKKTVNRMKRYGMKISREEKRAILRYLFQYRTN